MSISTGKPVSRLQLEFTSDEMAEIRAFSNLWPFGPWGDDFHSAKQCALIAKAHGSKEAKIDDFMIQHKDPDELSDDEQLYEFYKQLKAKNNGNVA